MTKTYPLYVTVLCCVLVAALCAGVAFDVGRRIGSNAVRQEAIRAGCAKSVSIKAPDMLDHTRVVYVTQFHWVTPDETLAPYRDDLDRFYRRFPEFSGRMTATMTQHK